MGEPIPFVHPFAAPDRVTVVSGLPRAGTSLLMQMLEAATLPLACDGARPPDADNPRGYYELAAVKRIRSDAGFLDACVGRAVKIVAPLVTAWPAGRAMRVVFVERDLGEVLASQRAMLERSGSPVGAGEEAALRRAFAAALDASRAWLASRAGIDVCFVEHARLLDAPGEVAAELAAFLERTGAGVRDAEGARRAAQARAAMAAVVDRALHRWRGGVGQSGSDAAAR